MTESSFTPRTLSTAAGEAQIYDHGAHLTGWTPVGQQPVLWLSSAAIFAPDKAIRGGVPLCFPWFGPGISGDRKPAHGVVRTATWRVVEQSEDAITYEVSDTDLDPDEAQAAGPFTARFEVRLGEQLDYALTFRNTGGAPAIFEAALHSYLAVGDVEQISLLGLDGVEYVDKTDGGVVRPQQGEVRLVQETDRIYRSSDPVTVVDPTLARSLRITSSGATRTVVWNPWQAKADEMSDMAGEEWRSFVCVEVAAVEASGAIELAPGGEHVIACTLQVGPFPASASA